MSECPSEAQEREKEGVGSEVGNRKIEGGGRAGKNLGDLAYIFSK